MTGGFKVESSRAVFLVASDEPWTAADLPHDYLAAAKALHVSAISQAISNSAREAVLEAVHRGGRFADYKRAFRAVDQERMAPWRRLMTKLSPAL